MNDWGRVGIVLGLLITAVWMTWEQSRRGGVTPQDGPHSGSATLILMSLLLRFCLGPILLVPSLAVAQTAVLDIPGNGSTLSGIGVISGWKCEATGPITVRINEGSSIRMVYGSERGDTRGQCGDTNNGFLAIFNWALLGEGEHTAVAYDNGEEFARSTFEVGTLGEEFVRGASAEVRVEDFPSPGESTLLVWNQSSQHFEVAPEQESGSPGLAPADQAAFDRLVVGKRMVGDDGSYSDFTSAGRLLEDNRWPWSYRYSNMGPDTGTLTLNFDTGGVCIVQLTFTSATTGTLTISQPISVTIGALIISCSDESGIGRRWRLIDIPPGGNDDHSDTRSGATFLPLGGSRSGQIETENDTDYFRVEVTEAGTLTVYTTGSRDVDGILYDSSGFFLTYDDDSGGGYNFRIQHPVSPGTYYISVESWEDTDSYTLHAVRE